VGEEAKGSYLLYARKISSIRNNNSCTLRTQFIGKEHKKPDFMDERKRTSDASSSDAKKIRAYHPGGKVLFGYCAGVLSPLSLAFCALIISNINILLLTLYGEKWLGSFN